MTEAGAALDTYGRCPACGQVVPERDREDHALGIDRDALDACARQDVEAIVEHDRGSVLDRLDRMIASAFVVA